MTNKYKPVPYVETSYDQLFADGHYDDAITMMQQFLDEHSNNPYAKMLAHINIASCYYCLHKIENAFEHLLQYKQLCIQYGNKQDHYNLYHISALIYEYEQNYWKAEMAIQECIQIATSLQLLQELTESYNLYSYIKNILGNFNEAVDYALAAQEIIYNINPENLFLVCQIHCNLASAYIRTGRYSEAHNILQLLSSNPFTQNNSRERSIFLYLKGFLQIKAGNMDAALSLLKEAQTIAESCNDVQLLRRLMWDLSHAYEEMNHFEEAFNSMRMYSVLCNELLNRRTTSNVGDIKLHHDLAVVKQRANMDPLSGVYNRNYLEDTCNEWLKEAKQSKALICCVAFDVDNFKLINDNYGHLVGDEVIKKVGKICTDHIQSKNGFVARYGGDEFVIIFRNHSQQEVFDISRAIFETLSNFSIEIDQCCVTLTVSMGIICNQSIIANKFAQLFKVADQALYMAKKQGKNQIVSLSNNCSI